MKQLKNQTRDISRWISLSELLREIEECKKDYNIPEGEDIQINCDSDYYDGATHYLEFKRLETDEEYKDRLITEQQEREIAIKKTQKKAETAKLAAEVKEWAERQQYEKLKAKFEKA